MKKIISIIIGTINLPIALASVPAKKWYFNNYTIITTMSPKTVTSILAVVLAAIAIYIHLKNR